MRHVINAKEKKIPQFENTIFNNRTVNVNYRQYNNRLSPPHIWEENRHSDTQKLFFLPSFPKFYTFSCASLPKLRWSILSAAFSPWTCNPENECRETKLRDPIWSSTTSLISCTSDLWEHSWSATLWQYRGIKQMKGNSLARAEIRWAEGEWREKKTI